MVVLTLSRVSAGQHGASVDWTDEKLEDQAVIAPGWEHTARARRSPSTGRVGHASTSVGVHPSRHRETGPHRCHRGNAQPLILRVSAPGRTRTCDQPLRRRLLYPLSYGGGAPILSHMRHGEFHRHQVKQRSARASASKSSSGLCGRTATGRTWRIGHAPDCAQQERPASRSSGGCRIPRAAAGSCPLTSAELSA